MRCHYWDVRTPLFVVMDAMGAYQGIVGITRRLWDKYNLFAPARGEVMGANILHDLCSGHIVGG